MDSYNTDDTYNNDNLSTGGHDSHGIDIPSSEDGQFAGIHVDDSSLHDVPSSTSSMGVNNVNVLTESTHTYTQGQEIPEVGETTGYQDQLRNILNPHGQATASSANGSESGYNETLTEIKDQTVELDHNVQKTQYSKADKSQIPFGCTGCATKCLHTCSGACFTSCSGSCDGSSSGR